MASSAPIWKIVKCPECGKFVCQAAPGSVVRIEKCPRCKRESVVHVAA